MKERVITRKKREKIREIYKERVYNVSPKGGLT
jgi:hypothetical protein